MKESIDRLIFDRYDRYDAVLLEFLRQKLNVEHVQQMQIISMIWPE